MSWCAKLDKIGHNPIPLHQILNWCLINWYKSIVLHVQLGGSPIFLVIHEF